MPGIGRNLPYRIEFTEAAITIVERFYCSLSTRARHLFIEVDRQELVVSAPVRRPPQFVIGEPADEAGIVTVWPADVAGSFPREDFEVGVEGIARGPALLLRAKRISDVYIRGDRKRRRPRIGDLIVRPGAKRVETPGAQTLCGGRAPRLPAAVLLLAGFAIGEAIGVLNAIMVEVHRIDALRQKESTVRIDEPPDPLDLLDTEVAARPNAFGDDTTPARSGSFSHRTTCAAFSRWFQVLTAMSPTIGCATGAQPGVPSAMTHAFTELP